MSDLSSNKLCSYEQRSQISKQPLLRKLFRIISEKKSNLCVSADFETFEQVLDFIELAGKHICMLKTQIRRFKGDHYELLRILYEKKKQHNFLLFEDNKYFDGKATIEAAYRVAHVEHADLVTVIPICGDGIFRAISDAVTGAKLDQQDEPRGCLAVCEVSFEGFIPVDSNKCLEVAQRNSDICVGIIAQKLQVSDCFSMIKATPGVHMSQSTDGSNQQWSHPSVAINNGADVIIVGRGIIAAPKDQWESLTCAYKLAAYNAYLEKLNKV